MASYRDAEREIREQVNEPDFALGDMRWSPWHLAMDKSYAPSDAWKPRQGEHVGYRNTSLFRQDTSKPAVYEFAVQPFDGCRRYPVYFGTTNGFKGSSWDTKFLKQDRLANQIDRVLKRGCKMFVRRAKVDPRNPVEHKGEEYDSVSELRQLMNDNYNYAWDVSTKYAHRKVMRDGKVISE